MRLVSLVPSTTHTICALGRRDWLVGCTKFCVEPPGLHREVALVGGTKDPQLDQIAALKPDIIFMNEEENRAADIESCRKIAQTIVHFPRSPADVPSMVESLGEAIGAAGLAKVLSRSIATLWRDLTFKTGSDKKGRFIYLIWRQPWMAVSKDTYISRFLESCGWENVVNTTDRYPVVDFSKLQSEDVVQVFFSSEPYPFRKRDIGFLRQDWPQMGEPWWVDGQLLSWHGAMTKMALEEMIQLQGGQPQKIMRHLYPPVGEAD